MDYVTVATLVAEEEARIRAELEAFANKNGITTAGYQLVFSLLVQKPEFNPVVKGNRGDLSLFISEVFTRDNFARAGITRPGLIINTIMNQGFHDFGPNRMGSDALTHLNWNNSSMADFMAAYKLLGEPRKLQGIGFANKCAQRLYDFLKFYGYL